MIQVFISVFHLKTTLCHHCTFPLISSPLLYIQILQPPATVSLHPICLLSSLSHTFSIGRLSLSPLIDGFLLFEITISRQCLQALLGTCSIQRNIRSIHYIDYACLNVFQLAPLLLSHIPQQVCLQFHQRISNPVLVIG